MNMDPEAGRIVASEVLELGQTLFDALIEAATDPVAEGATQEPFPEDDLREAVDEFFVTLRLLLDLEDAR
jgi:hypothetical protein